MRETMTAEPAAASPAVRIETDSMGMIEVPNDRYYGAQTARAVENLPVSDLRFNRRYAGPLCAGPR